MSYFKNKRVCSITLCDNFNWVYYISIAFLNADADLIMATGSRGLGQMRD